MEMGRKEREWVGRGGNRWEGVGMSGNGWKGGGIHGKEGMEALDGSSGNNPGSLGAPTLSQPHSLKYSNIWEQHPKKFQLRTGGEAPIKDKFKGEVSELFPNRPRDSGATSREIFQQIPLISSSTFFFRRWNNSIPSQRFPE